MEQIIKSCGEISLRNGDVLNEDRISELPEDLLVRILSSLPTKNVIAMSVLSKRWRSLWKMVPNLKFRFEYQINEHHRFSTIICTSLLSLEAPVLDSLHLHLKLDTFKRFDIGRWTGIAFARHVRRLVVDLHNPDDNYPRLVTFPSDLCSCNRTLETLELKGRYLVVIRKSYSYQETCTLAVPSLQRLTIEDYETRHGDGGYVINAPSLKYLNIKAFKGLEFCLIENAPELVEAKIIDISKITNENILVSITSAKRLTLHLSPLEIKYPIGTIFYQLVYLELGTRKRKWWNLLSLMLDNSPKLKILKLIDPFSYGRRARTVGWEWEQPKCVPECLLFHLETFVWTRYEWEREDEKEVATYILKNARRLKKATFSTKPINSEEFEKLEKRRGMLNELASVATSNSCHCVRIRMIS